MAGKKVERKSWIKSKGQLGGIGLMLSAIIKIIVTGEYSQDDINLFLMGLALLGIRRAIDR